MDTHPFLFTSQNGTLHLRAPGGDKSDDPPFEIKEHDRADRITWVAATTFVGADANEQRQHLLCRISRDRAGAAGIGHRGNEGVPVRARPYRRLPAGTIAEPLERVRASELYEAYELWCKA